MNDSNRGIQLLRFYLRKWKYFDVNIAYLSDVEKIQMKILYASLKSLNEYEIKFLAIRYRFIGSKPLSVIDAAEVIGIPVTEYENKTKRVEMKLIPQFLENEQNFKKELNRVVQTDSKRRKKKPKFNYGSENY